MWLNSPSVCQLQITMCQSVSMLYHLIQEILSCVDVMTLWFDSRRLPTFSLFSIFASNTSNLSLWHYMVRYSSLIVIVLLLQQLHPLSPTPNLLSYCIFIALWMPTNRWAPHFKTSLRWGEWSCALCSRSRVQRDQNLWSCDDQKGYSSEDQHFF